MQIAIFYQITLILGDYVLLGVLKLGYLVFNVYGVDLKFVERRYNEEFILYYKHECRV